MTSRQKIVTSITGKGVPAGVVPVDSDLNGLEDTGKSIKIPVFETPHFATKSVPSDEFFDQFFEDSEIPKEISDETWKKILIAARADGFDCTLVQIKALAEDARRRNRLEETIVAPQPDSSRVSPVADWIGRRKTSIAKLVSENFPFSQWMDRKIPTAVIKDFQKTISDLFGEPVMFDYVKHLVYATRKSLGRNTSKESARPVASLTTASLRKMVLENFDFTQWVNRKIPHSVIAEFTLQLSKRLNRQLSTEYIKILVYEGRKKFVEKQQKEADGKESKRILSASKESSKKKTSRKTKTKKSSQRKVAPVFASPITESRVTPSEFDPVLPLAVTEGIEQQTEEAIATLSSLFASVNQDIDVLGDQITELQDKRTMLLSVTAFLASVSKLEHGEVFLREVLKAGNLIQILGKVFPGFKL